MPRARFPFSFQPPICLPHPLSPSVTQPLLHPHVPLTPPDSSSLLKWYFPVPPPTSSCSPFQAFLPSLLYQTLKEQISLVACMNRAAVLQVCTHSAWGAVVGRVWTEPSVLKCVSSVRSLLSEQPSNHP